MQIKDQTMTDSRAVSSYDFPLVSYAGKSIAWVLTSENWVGLPACEREELTRCGCAPFQQFDLNSRQVEIGCWFGALTIDEATIGGPFPQAASVGLDHDGLGWRWLASDPREGVWERVARQIATEALPVFRRSVNSRDAKKWMAYR